MAEVKATRADNPDGTHRHIWSPLNQTDTSGEAVAIAGAADRTIQFTGVFDGATIVLQGSCEEKPTNWETLTDPQGNPISKTQGALEAVLENVSWIRPLISSAGASTAINAILLSRK